MKRFVTHVRKDTQGNIIFIKTIETTLNTLEAVNRINKLIDYFYVSDGFSEVAVAVYDEKWLRTHADGKWTDNLDNLPRF